MSLLKNKRKKFEDKTLKMSIVSSSIKKNYHLGNAVEEWDAAAQVLLHPPGDECAIPALHPPSALYESPFDPSEAAVEHCQFCDILRREGCEVITVRDIVMNVAPIGELRKFAEQSVSIEFEANFPAEEHAEQHAIVAKSIQSFSREKLFGVILQRPTLVLRKTPENTGCAASYRVNPLSNLMFMRDQTITTRKGRVVCHLNSPQRVFESLLLREVLRWMASDAIFEVSGAGRLEGGDFLPAGDVAFLGQGLRTNEEGVRQLLDAKVFGSRYVVIVKDSWKNQEEMHLDTFFNILGPTSAVLVDTRLFALPNTKEYLVCDVYEQTGDDGTYVCTSHDVSFVEELSRQNFRTIVPVPKADQLIYGCNFLTLRENHIVLVKRGAGVSELFKEALRKAGVTYVEAEMTALTSEYGAAHCMTQVSRTPQTSPAVTPHSRSPALIPQISPAPADQEAVTSE